MSTHNGATSWPGSGANTTLTSSSGAAAVARSQEDRLPGELRFCLFIIFYFAFCDTILKIFPLIIAKPLRYLPEALLHFVALRSLIRGKGKIWNLPIFWPMLFCAVSMVYSTVINGGSQITTAHNYYQAFRLISFAIILMHCEFKPAHVTRFIRSFMVLIVIQMFIGLLELIGGSDAKLFFVPNWSAGGSGYLAPMAMYMLHANDTGYLLGTMGNYNVYGMLMCLGMLLAITMHSRHKKPGYQVLAWTTGIAVILSFSRHSLINMVVILMMTFWFHRKRGTLFKVFKYLVIAVAVGGILISSSQALRDSIQERLGTIISGQATTADENNARLLMLVVLTPAFVHSYPFFGQGPFEAPSGTGVLSDPLAGPTVKAAPSLPGWVTRYLSDVVWLAFFGAYGVVGLATRMLVYGVVIYNAMRLRKARICPEYTMLGEMCLMAMAIFLITGFFSPEIEARDCAPMVWCLAGMVFSVTARHLLNQKQAPKNLATANIRKQ